MSEHGLAGVLALQGDVPEHVRMLRLLLGNDRVIEVKGREDLARVDALVLPGGESTTLSRLMDRLGMREPLIERVGKGMGVLATCAGLILVSSEVERSPHGRDPSPLAVLDVRVRRNDYGRQVESFETAFHVKGLPGVDFRGAFIRAPRILSAGPRVEVMANLGGSPVMVREGNVWGLTFHPEIGDDPRIHSLFLEESGLSLVPGTGQGISKRTIP